MHIGLGYAQHCQSRWERERRPCQNICFVDPFHRKKFVNENIRETFEENVFVRKFSETFIIDKFLKHFRKKFFGKKLATYLTKFIRQKNHTKLFTQKVL
jgi:hypothetical protein